MVDQQRDELIKSIYGIGEYRLAKEYQHLPKEFTDWAQMTPGQKDAHIDNVLLYKPRKNRGLDASLQKCVEVLDLEKRLAVVLTKEEAAKILKKSAIVSDEGSVLTLQNNKYCVTENKMCSLLSANQQQVSFAVVKHLRKITLHAPI